MTLSETVIPVAADSEAIAASEQRDPRYRPPRSTGRLARHPVSLRIASVVLLLVLWQILSLVVGETVLPTPLTTAEALGQMMTTPAFWDDFRVTMIRILVGFAASMVLGIALGLFMGLSRIAEGLFDIWVVVGQTIPSLCWVIISFIMFGLNDVATIVAVTLTSFPIIAVNMWAGVKAIDPKLGQMAGTMGASRWLRIRSITIPQVMPAVMASARFGFGLVWKVVVLAELLGRTDGIGYRLNYYYQLFRMENVFALTLFFSILMIVLELGVFKPIEKRMFRWRPEALK